MTAQRFHILGGPGTGKTTLAHRLATHFSLPLHDLDNIAYRHGAAQPDDVRDAAIRQIAESPAWVTEGIYLGWTDPLLQTADHIIWLDLPWRTAAWRIALRHVRAVLTRTNRHGGLANLWRFLRWARTYYASQPSPAPEQGPEAAASRDATARHLASLGDRVIHCQTSMDVRVWLARVTREDVSPPPAPTAR